MTEAVLENTREAFRVEMAPDGVALLRFDLPGEKVNKLTSGVLQELEVVLKEIAADSAVKAVVFLSGKEGAESFIAGADIREIEEITFPAEATSKARQAQDILDGLSRLPQPVICAIHGACLGGGTELALACDFRVATDHPKTTIGLPEVKLGIIPGFGGTQRLPRLVGLRRALDLILAGKTVDARRAAKIGLVDHVVPASLMREQVIEFAAEVVAGGGKWPKARARKRSLSERFLEGTRLGRKIVRHFALKGLSKKASREHYPAPYKALEAIFAACEMPISQGLRFEADLVGPLIVSATSKNLISIFFDSETLRRGEASPTGDAERDEPRAIWERSPRRVAVLGAGVMGGGIAALLARKKLHVRLKDLQDEALTAGLAAADKSFRELVRRRRMSPDERENCLAAISTTTETTGFGEAEVVIEAVVEDMEIKKSVLQEIEPRLQDDAIFATNTSSLSIDELASVAERPQNVAGMHFFNPVHRMPLVEVIHGEATSQETIERLESLTRQLGKYPLRVRNAPGFLVNRLLMPYLNEAAALFEQGHSVEALDREAKSFGMPMGPFALLDEVGLDVAGKVAKVLHAAFGERARPADVLTGLVEHEKLLGKKGGQGFYRYRGGKRRGVNPAVLQYGGKGLRNEDPALALRRMLATMVNEAARCLDEGIVEAPWQVDIGMIFGTGFPPFTGGLLRWADSVGLKGIVEVLDRHQKEYADRKGRERYEVCPPLRRRAESGERFYAGGGGDGESGAGSAED